MASEPTPEAFQPVPLEEVVGTTYVKGEDGNPTPVEVKWRDLNEKEQRVIKLIVDGNYGEAAKLTGDGKNTDYDKTKTHNFLNAVGQQHDKTVALAFSNNNVSLVLNG